MENLTPDFDFQTFGIGIEEIQSDAEQMITEGERAAERKGMFLVKTANGWIEQAKTRPIPKMLFGEFWYESELCILFADTNLGKSILAVQICNSISKGEVIPGFKLEAERQRVLYFDFELSSKTFERRYSVDFTEHYQFDEYFHRAEINPDADIPNEFKTFEEYLNHSLEKSIIETGAKVLVIDNITYLRADNEKAKDALPLMKQLKALKSKYGLSILCLSHTPKRDLSKPITRNDLQGSKMQINFADSSYSIGENHSEKNTRYLKQIKSRNTEIIYDSENVCVCQIEKPFNFLQFRFITFSNEQEHLKQYTEQDKEKRIAEVLELKGQGKTNVEIARTFGVSETAVRKWIKKAQQTEPTSTNELPY